MQMLLGGLVLVVVGIVFVRGWLSDDWHVAAGAAGAAGILALVVGIVALIAGVVAALKNAIQKSN